MDQFDKKSYTFDEESSSNDEATLNITVPNG